MKLAHSPEVARLLIQLESSGAFCELMEILERRATRLAEWSSLIEDETQLRWAQGRVQELTGLLFAWNQRRGIREDAVAPAPDKEW